MKAEPRYLWAARDKDDPGRRNCWDYNAYSVFEGACPPTKTDERDDGFYGIEWSDEDDDCIFVAELCAKLFHKYVRGIRLKPGQGPVKIQTPIEMIPRGKD